MRDLPRHVAQLPEPKAPQEMCGRFRNNPDRLKWETLGVFAFLRNYHRSASVQRGYLPVDMQHLRFQKCRAITSDNRACVERCSQRARLDAHCLHVQIRSTVLRKSGGIPPHSTTQAPDVRRIRGHVLECGAAAPFFAAAMQISSLFETCIRSSLRLNFNWKTVRAPLSTRARAGRFAC